MFVPTPSIFAAWFSQKIQQSSSYCQLVQLLLPSPETQYKKSPLPRFISIVSLCMRTVSGHLKDESPIWETPDYRLEYMLRVIRVIFHFMKYSASTSVRSEKKRRVIDSWGRIFSRIQKNVQELTKTENFQERFESQKFWNFYLHRVKYCVIPEKWSGHFFYRRFRSTHLHPQKKRLEKASTFLRFLVAFAVGPGKDAPEAPL